MTPEMTQVLGAAATVYGLGGALSVLLQARQMYVRGRSCDVSARFLTVYVGGFAIWLLYGLGIESFPSRSRSCSGSAGPFLWPRRTPRPAKTHQSGFDPARPFLVSRIAHRGGRGDGRPRESKPTVVKSR